MTVAEKSKKMFKKLQAHLPQEWLAAGEPVVLGVEQELELEFLEFLKSMPLTGHQLKPFGQFLGFVNLEGY